MSEDECGRAAERRRACVCPSAALSSLHSHFTVWSEGLSLPERRSCDHRHGTSKVGLVKNSKKKKKLFLHILRLSLISSSTHIL